ncbi:MAG: hypothetical protein JXL81_10075 [Deltaproteobacteria bacterium]|nr:hypothetical protein [Deltaproteobacteria bacterium]
MTVHLLSYSCSGLSLLKEITPLFSPVKIYIPWGGVIPEYADNKDIIPLYPPERFKPDTDFNILLNDCFNWAYEQGEKSRKEIIKTGHTTPTSSESLRHIKTILANRISDTSEKDMILRWHMLLHLADRLEKNINDANMMLENLKNRPSPLLNNADLTENTRYPFENLSLISPDFLINDKNLKQLLGAWHGLFNSMIDEGDMLLTLDRLIFDHLADEWDNVNNNIGRNNPDIIVFRSPIFKDKKESISIGDDIGRIIKSNLKHKDRIAAIKEITSDLESRHKEKDMGKQILFSIMFFKPPEILEKVEKDSFLKFLSGRALILAEHGRQR